MGLFGKKKKKKLDDFSDDGQDDGPGAGGGGGGMAVQGSDDNPYANDPAHKHFVKLLDSNGLVRHRRAFIRNSIYTVKHAKECDKDRLEKAGVFLEADRKKLLRIFKDADVMESEIDNQREQEKMEMDGPGDMDDFRDDEPREKKKKKKKKDKEKGKDKKSKKDKDKKKKKKKKNKGSDDEDEINDLQELDDMDEEDEPKKKKKKKKKKNKDKDKDIDIDEKEVKKDKKSKKSKKSKKKKKDKPDFDDGGSGEEPDLDAFDDLPLDEEELGESKEKKSKKKKPKKGKKDKKDKKSKDKKKNKGKSKKEDDFEDDIFVEDKLAGGQDKTEIDMDALDEEADREEVLQLEEEDLYSPEPTQERRTQETSSPQKDHVQETKAVEKDLDKEMKKTERRMSNGSQALRLLNEKLGNARSRRSSLSSNPRQRRRSLRSVTTLDEDEDTWWKSLSKKGGKSDRRISFTDESLSDASTIIRDKRNGKESKKGYDQLSEAEQELVKNYRKQKKVTRRHRPQPMPYQYQQQVQRQQQQPIPNYHVQVPDYNLPQPPPPPSFQVHKDTPSQAKRNLQPVGQAQPTQAIDNQIVTSQPSPIPPPLPYWYFTPPPPFPEYTYDTHPQSEEEAVVEDDNKSVADYSKYKYYKDKYNERKKLRKLKKHKERQKLKRSLKIVQEKAQQKEKKKKIKKRISKEKNYIDVSKDLYADNHIWPLTKEGNMISDSEINADNEYSEHERQIQNYGSNDFFFNQDLQEFSEQGTHRRGNKHRNSSSKDRVNYYHTSMSQNQLEDKSSDNEMYILRKKLAAIGASKYYPLLVKHGILSIRHCTISKLEKLPISSKNKKRNLIQALLQLQQNTKNIKKYDHLLFLSETSQTESDVALENKRQGLKSALKKRKKASGSPKLRKKFGTSKNISSRSRHYFSPTESVLKLVESDQEPDHVRVSKRRNSLKDETGSKSDKKSVTFDLNDEGEVSLPSVSDVEDNSDSELTLDSYDSA